LGYLPKPYGTAAVRAWKAARLRFIRTTAPGEVKITSTVTHIALGASPADDGSDDYYLHAPVVDDDPKGVGAFLLAGSEMELLRHS
jgi:unsaturated rhamnogalacturonyl hydrolase